MGTRYNSIPNIKVLSSNIRLHMNYLPNYHKLLPKSNMVADMPSLDLADSSKIAFQNITIFEQSHSRPTTDPNVGGKIRMI